MRPNTSFFQHICIGEYRDLERDRQGSSGAVRVFRELYRTELMHMDAE